MKVFIGVPSGGSVEPLAMQALFNMDRAEHDVHLEIMYGYEVDRTRNAIAQRAMDGGYDYVLMVDSDTILPENALVDLLNPVVDVSVGLYREKRYRLDGEYTQMHKFSKDTINYDTTTRIHISELKEDRTIVRGGGAGCLMIKTSVFDRIEKPWFKFHEYPSGAVLSEDLWFFERLRKKNIPVYADKRVLCGHVMKDTYTFTE